jgi:hypothetical protein
MHALPNTSNIPITQLLLTFTVALLAENSAWLTQFIANSFRVLSFQKITVTLISKKEFGLLYSTSNSFHISTTSVIKSQ